MWTHRRVTVDAAGRRGGFSLQWRLERRERVSLTSAPPLGEARPGASARRLSTVLASAPRAPRGWYTRLGTRSFSGDRGRLRFYKGPQFRGGAGGAPGIAGPTGKPSQRISWLGYLYGVGFACAGAALEAPTRELAYGARCLGSIWTAKAFSFVFSFLFCARRVFYPHFE